MKKFWDISKRPLRIAIIATVGCLIDFILAGLFVKGATFAWVAFLFWTLFFGATIKERIKGFIGAIIGFISAIIMILISNAFTLNIWVISISTLVAVFIVNGLVMYLEKTEKFFTNSISGIFIGISLTFSGFGVGLNPLNSVKEAFIMLCILSIYGALGLVYGFLSNVKFKTKQTQKEISENKNEDTTNNN